MNAAARIGRGVMWMSLIAFAVIYACGRTGSINATPTIAGQALAMAAFGAGGATHASITKGSWWKTATCWGAIQALGSMAAFMWILVQAGSGQ